MRFHSRWQSSIFTTAICLICPVLIAASDEPNLSNEQMRQFLLTAKVVASRHTSEGITQPWRLTLTDGTLTHDAHFETVDEHKPSMQFAGGRTELNFVDSYKNDIAGYALADLLGLDDMVPMYVPRKWQGTSGALSWWVPVMIGAMFAPRPERVADELMRVCRPGGLIAMANWTPEGFVGKSFQVIAEMVPPPAGLPAPALWGDEQTVRQRFAKGISKLSLSRHKAVFDYPFSPKEVVDFFRQYFGPIQAAFSRLDKQGQ